jgi:hypothetical protein
MEKNSEILDELIDLQSPLADMSRHMLFAVPDGYFNNLTDSIIDEIQTSDKTASWKEQNPFAIPGQYFEQLPGNILARVKQEGNTVVKQKNIMLPVLRWAAAAVVILGIGFLTYTNIAHKPMDTEKALSKIPDELIKDYLQQNIDDIDADLLVGSTANIDARIDALEDEDIINYLDETGWDKESTTL